MLKHCTANRKRRLSVLPNVGPYIYTTLKYLALQGAPYTYDVSRITVKGLFSGTSLAFSGRKCENPLKQNQNRPQYSRYSKLLSLNKNVSSFIDAFALLRQTTIRSASSCLFLSPSLRLHGTTRFQLAGF
jgi:hypothetical protein